MRLTQMIGMVYYEARMHWRRRGLLMLAFFFVGALVLGSTMFRVTVEAVPKLASKRHAEAFVMVMGSAAILQITWPVALMFSILAIPPILSDTIPKDRQVGVRNLLDSLPLGRATYLTGKLLGTWASLLVGLAGVALLFGIATLLILGPYDLPAYLTTWIVGVAPVALFTSGMSVLLAAGQPTRRRAVFVGIGFAAFCLAMLLTTTGDVRDAISLTRPTHLLTLQFEQMNYLAAKVAHAWPESGFGANGAENLAKDLRFLGLNPSPIQIPLTIALGIAQVGLVWLIVWGWMRWKENSQ